MPSISVFADSNPEIDQIPIKHSLLKGLFASRQVPLSTFPQTSRYCHSNTSPFWPCCFMSEDHQYGNLKQQPENRITSPLLLGLTVSLLHHVAHSHSRAENCPRRARLDACWRFHLAVLAASESS